MGRMPGSLQWGTAWARAQWRGEGGQRLGAGKESGDTEGTTALQVGPLWGWQGLPAGSIPSPTLYLGALSFFRFWPRRGLFWKALVESSCD